MLQRDFKRNSKENLIQGFSFVHDRRAESQTGDDEATRD